jgi:hypothetical protein
VPLDAVVDFPCERRVEQALLRAVTDRGILQRWKNLVADEEQEEPVTGGDRAEEVSGARGEERVPQ